MVSTDNEFSSLIVALPMQSDKTAVAKIVVIYVKMQLLYVQVKKKWIIKQCTVLQPDPLL